MKIKRFPKSLFPIFTVVWLSLPSNPAFAVETAPRITDREIVEKLAKLEEGQKNLDKRFDDLRSEMNSRFEDVNRRMDDLRSEMNNRFNDLNQRFSVLQWMFGLFITIALAIFAAIAKVLWDLSRRQAAYEKNIQNLSGEIESLKQTDFKLMDQIRALIEALKPPRGVL